MSQIEHRKRLEARRAQAAAGQSVLAGFTAQRGLLTGNSEDSRLLPEGGLLKGGGSEAADGAAKERDEQNSPEEQDLAAGEPGASASLGDDDSKPLGEVSFDWAALEVSDTASPEQLREQAAAIAAELAKLPSEAADAHLDELKTRHELLYSVTVDEYENLFTNPDVQ